VLDNEGEWRPPGLDPSDTLEFFDEQLHRVIEALRTRDPSTHVFSWYEPDQTVGFWIRRMAQETVIHRVDGELGAGVPNAAIPEDLALDGVDEILVAFVGYGSRAWPDEYAPTLAEADGRTIRLETTGASWLVRPTPEAVEVRPCDDEAADAVVRGEPVDLLLWLWNRAADDVVSSTGDPTLIAHFRRVMVAGTQ